MIENTKNGPVFLSPRKSKRPWFLSDLAVHCRFRAGILATYLGISRRQLERDFRAGLAISPKYWLRERRAVYAEQLIREGHQPEVVAELLGFKKYNHFVHEMKFFHGADPRDLLVGSMIKARTQSSEDVEPRQTRGDPDPDCPVDQNGKAVPRERRPAASNPMRPRTARAGRNHSPPPGSPAAREDRYPVPSGIRFSEDRLGKNPKT